MALLYLGVMILVQISGYDVVNDVNFPGYLGAVFAIVAGVIKIWREVSR